MQLVGLTHDLGHVLALSQFPDEYDRACRRLSAGEEDFDRLIALELGATTAQLAALAAHSWSLPSVVAIPMAYWRTPAIAPEHRDLTALVHIAHILAHAAGFTPAGDAFVPPFDDATLSRLNLRTSDLELVLTQMFESMDELELYEGALRG
jgi:HD-like signal output (HDOD) protein